MSEQFAAKPLTPFNNLNRKTAVDKVDQAKQENILELTQAIREAHMDWQNALDNFENAEGTDMVDYYTYCIKASQIRYEYLLKKVKQAKVQ